jgi:hypothetical protein
VSFTLRQPGICPSASTASSSGANQRTMAQRTSLHPATGRFGGSDPSPGEKALLFALDGRVKALEHDDRYISDFGIDRPEGIAL